MLDQNDENNGSRHQSSFCQSLNSASFISNRAISSFSSYQTASKLSSVSDLLRSSSGMFGVRLVAVITWGDMKKKMDDVAASVSHTRVCLSQ